MVHELAQLAGRIDWDFLDAEMPLRCDLLAQLFERGQRP